MKTPLIAFCCTALLAGTALANDNDDENQRDKKDTFAMLDSDSDGKLSKDEVSSSNSLSSSFTMIDRNSDGYISRGEFRRNTMPNTKRD
ncbi:MAG TPA: hypothetical protein VF033_06070 [Steroidobacteraceae bacterium]|jgi:Ca2+-binding EF-hand superfamily protein